MRIHAASLVALLVAVPVLRAQSRLASEFPAAASLPQCKAESVDTKGWVVARVGPFASIQLPPSLVASPQGDTIRFGPQVSATRTWSWRTRDWSLSVRASVSRDSGERPAPGAQFHDRQECSASIHGHAVYIETHAWIMDANSPPLFSEWAKWHGQGDSVIEVSISHARPDLRQTGIAIVRSLVFGGARIDSATVK